jgi:hypothetical protein
VCVCECVCVREIKIICNFSTIVTSNSPAVVRPFIFPRKELAHTILSRTAQVVFEKLTVAQSWDSAVGIATGYGLDGQGIGARVPVGARFSPLTVVQTSCRAHPGSYRMGTVASFPGDKTTGDMKLTFHLQLAPSSRIRGSIHPLPHMSSMRSA